MSPLSHKYILSGLLAVQLANAPPLQDAIQEAFVEQTTFQNLNGACRNTSVAILGAGMAGIAAAQSLTNASVTDFVIVDVNSYIGGRVKNAKFGKDLDGNPYTVELGANWVQGLGSANGPENPIWILAQKYNLNTTYSNLSSILTYDQNGPNDYMKLLDDYDNAYSLVEEDVASMLSQGHQDRSFRVGLSLAGWRPKKSMLHQATEFWKFDWEYSHSPDLTSQTFAVVVSFCFCRMEVD
jgi:polyamine oxidase